MKLIHIIEASATGTLSMAALLANEQASKGIETTVIISIRPETPRELGNIFSNDVNLQFVDMSSLPGKIKSFFLLARIFKDSDADVVVMHSSYAGFIGRIAALLAHSKAKLFYIPHCISFMRTDIGRVKKYIFVMFERLANIKKSIYIACSNSEGEAIKNNINCMCVVVENAVKDNFKNDLDGECLKVPFKVITVGQVRVQKNPRLFSRISEKVNSLVDNVEFIWVGDGDDALKSTLADNKVNVTGWVNSTEVREYLKEADIYLSTSSWEGMPVSLIEANYAGVTVVAKNCAGNNDIITTGVNGFLFDQEDEAVSIIYELLESPDKRREVSGNALSIAKDRFSYDRYIKQMDELFFERNQLNAKNREGHPCV
ncbi:glycosyltransferase [Modicisalibacter luteus]|uniref:Glycosyltransferase n=1 Tax=Modicisalibacter luteus TaxID=453962 RepID=A0ABV7LY78_9GAMM|nr:glycosyltransferase [Halomonas lutea]GHB05419.1 glycosyl transferase [Halomonas lutea]